MSANGRLLPSELTTVEGISLAKPTANAYLRMKAAAKAAGVDIWIAQPIGGYRSYAVQADMKVNPGKYGLSTVSTVNIASAGYSTHGLGNALDIGSFGSAYGTAGAKRSTWLIQHAPEFGFFREFGDKDPNHFHHDGFTAVAPIISAASSGGLTPIEEDDVPNYTEWSQKDKDNLVKDIWQNFRYFKNYAGDAVAPIDMLRETERTANTVLVGVHNTEDKVNNVISGVGTLAADDGADAATIAAAIRTALPADLAKQVVAELGKQITS